jgi:4-oxalocrotonate tautomerase
MPVLEVRYAGLASLTPRTIRESERKNLMPFIHVSMRKGTTEEYRRNIFGAIREGMVESMRIPADDYFGLIHELDDANFFYDANYCGRPRSDKFLFVHFFWNARAAVTKQIIFETIADKLVEKAGVRRDDIIMNIVEPAPENWWIEGREVDPHTGTDARIKL